MFSRSAPFLLALFFIGAPLFTHAAIVQNAVTCSCKGPTDTTVTCLVQDASKIPGGNCTGMPTISEALKGWKCDANALTISQGRPVAEGGVCAQGPMDAFTAGGGDSIKKGVSSEKPTPAIIPQLNVQIPGFAFTGSAVTNDTSSLLAQYIAGVYSYAISIAAVAATIMFVYGAFLYLLGGAIESIHSGKQIMKDAVVGLLLVLGANMILRTVNPATLSLAALHIEGVEFETAVYEESGGYVYSNPATKRAICKKTAEFDPIFQKYAGCAGLDWRVLKAVADKESCFDPTVVNASGFIGLFQTKPNYCSLRKYGRGADCLDLTNPDNNTASAAGGQLKGGADIVRKLCPQLTDTKKIVTLIYFAHNSGGGALQQVIGRVGCNATDSQYDQAANAFWEGRASSKGPPPGYTARMPTARRVATAALAFGAPSSNPYVTGSCPLTGK